MSTIATPVDAAARQKALRRDTLASSVVFLIALSCVQPVVALARGVLFCRWLEPVDMGCWDMALAFMTLVAPLVIFGIPGSFGRYVEHYSQRGQLAMFLRRTTLVTAALAILAVAAVAAGGRWVSWLIFHDPGYVDLVLLVSVGLGTMIAFGFVTELLTALRLFRVVSGLQLLKGVAFALAGAALLLGLNRGPGSIIVAHAASCLLAAGVGLLWLWPTWRALPADAPRGTMGYVTQAHLWQRLLPFALWVWVANILTNLFEIVDRTMIVHCGRFTPEEALAAVGQYHSSRIVPLLFVSFAGMLASIVLPHLTRDWEAGRRRDVDARLNLTLKAFALALLAGSTLVLVAAPALFQYAFRGKYDGGLAVLPWTLAYCAWFGLSFVIGNYLWCAERVRLGSAALAVGLAVNVALNLVLLPSLGLLGAVLATAAAKLTVLAVALGFSRMLGMRLDLGTCLLAVSPFALVLGPAGALAVLAIIGLAVAGTDRIFNAEEKRLLHAAVRQAGARFGFSWARS